MDQVGGDVPGEDISEQSLIEEACVEASERDYSGGTNERVPESHRKRSKEEAREEVSRRRSQRSGEEVKEEIPVDDGGGQIQRSHFKCFYCDQEGQEELSKEQSTRSVFRGSNNSNDGCG